MSFITDDARRFLYTEIKTVKDENAVSAVAGYMLSDFFKTTEGYIMYDDAHRRAGPAKCYPDKEVYKLAQIGANTMAVPIVILDAKKNDESIGELNSAMQQMTAAAQILLSRFPAQKFIFTGLMKGPTVCFWIFKMGGQEPTPWWPDYLDLQSQGSRIRQNFT